MSGTAGFLSEALSELRDEAEKICGKPSKPVFEDKVVAAIKWVDGTVIDVVRKING